MPNQPNNTDSPNWLSAKAGDWMVSVVVHEIVETVRSLSNSESVVSFAVSEFFLSVTSPMQVSDPIVWTVCMKYNLMLRYAYCAISSLLFIRNWR